MPRLLPNPISKEKCIMGKLDDFFNDPEYADLLGDATKSESASPNTELDRLLEPQ